MLFLLKVIIPRESLILRHILFLGFVLAALTLHSGRALTSVC